MESKFLITIKTDPKEFNENDFDDEKVENPFDMTEEVEKQFHFAFEEVLEGMIINDGDPDGSEKFLYDVIEQALERDNQFPEKILTISDFGGITISFSKLKKETPKNGN